MEIICVGNELLIGKILNTNAQWLSKHATALGVTVKRITVAPDDVKEIAKVIQEVLKRKPQFVVTTGGLGPTFDDKTLEGIAKALNRKLEINQKALRMVKEKYEIYAKKRAHEIGKMTQPRVKMATLPQNTEPIPNPIGTAPGVQANLENTTLIALPGVPSEMEAIFEQTLASLLKQASDNTAFYENSLYADNLMESTLAPLIDKVMKNNSGVYIKSHPRGEENKPHIEIHLSTMAKENEKPEEKLQQAMTQLSKAIAKVGGKICPAQQNV